jgi:hypothetical protein
MMLRTFFGKKFVLVALAIATTLAFSNVVVPAIGGPSATNAKVKRGPRGPQGPPGPQGTPGAPGAPGTPAANLWAVVAATGAVTQASGGLASVAVVHNGAGSYQVFFNLPVSACTYAATLQSSAGLISATNATTNSVLVVTRNTAGTATDQAFHLAALC